MRWAEACRRTFVRGFTEHKCCCNSLCSYWEDGCKINFYSATGTLVRSKHWSGQRHRNSTCFQITSRQHHYFLLPLKLSVASILFISSFSLFWRRLGEVNHRPTPLQQRTNITVNETTWVSTTASRSLLGLTYFKLRPVLFGGLMTLLEVDGSSFWFMLEAIRRNRGGCSWRGMCPQFYSYVCSLLKKHKVQIVWYLCGL